ncbi:hypothetical protein [Nitratifractor salsuginis]|uniref:Uncharacterized protein n=1 Tax=Nitratifractor salsuginis (strain DSM 16511 / JCM 12458 / E9I37-1) TaxID=749222 RepID=E6X1G5_NITSE|nr:hypothetical protein [Nitratifractor salsuginis]ADV45898.1 hypothetical protein Nitsa_0630 [Nitratifractor salsuginis DSM 16511]
MPSSSKKILFVLIAASFTMLTARPISAPLAVFESTKLPHRTLKEGPSIFGTLPFFNEKNATEAEKQEYKKMVKEVKEREKANEKYRHSKAMQVFESTKIHRDPSQGPSAVRKAFSEVFSAVGLEENEGNEKKVENNK